MSLNSSLLSRVPTASYVLSLLLGPCAALVVIMAISNGTIPAFTAYSFGLAAVYGMAVLSVSLLAGWGGVWSVGHPALLAIGAYAAAYGSAQGWPLEIVILVAATLCALAGAFLGFAGSRFSILYIALLTLAFSLVALEVIGAWTSVTNGDAGVPVFALDSLLGTVDVGGPSASSLAVGTFGLTLSVAIVVRSSALRMRLVAAKNNPLVARTIGVSPVSQVSLAFAASGAVTGVAGILLGLISGFVSPASFSLILAINFIAAAVLGGAGSVLGAVIGGAFLAWSPTLAQTTSIDQPYLIGGVLIVALIFVPNGLAPLLVRSLVALLPRDSAVQATEIQEDVVVDGEPDRIDLDAVVLEARGLGVQYGGLHAVKDVDLITRPSEVVAIIGPNGAGKTTFVNAVSGLTPGGRVSGSVSIGGSELRGGATRRKAAGVARTFQHAELFTDLTILENVLATGRRAGRAQRRRATAMLAAVGLGDVTNRLPSELPFGLQKRADLARALAEKASLLILDEPFGGLDADERQLLASFIGRQCESGTSIVIIDHVLDDLFRVADRAVAFDFGQLIAAGSPKSIMLDEQVRTSYLGVGSDHIAPPPVDAGTGPALTLRGVSYEYPGVQALRDVDVDLATGSVLGIVGANGAGKSTLGRVMHGGFRPSNGERTVHERDGRGLRISLVPEGRALFKTLSVEENLEVAGYGAGFSRAELRHQVDLGLDWLPEKIRDRRAIPAGALSGGEQQLVAIARALTAAPDILILDEPALGLAPAMVDEVYGKISELAQRGVTTVLLEQLLSRALWASSHVLVLRDGRVVAEGNREQSGFQERAEMEYFGTDHAPETPLITHDAR